MATRTTARIRNRTGLAVAALASLAGLLPVSPAAGADSEGSATGFWAALAEDGTVRRLEVPELDMAPAADDGAGTFGPYLLDPWTWAECYTFNNEALVIQAYPFWWNGEEQTINLKCGNKDYSYKHIEKHADEWAEVQAAAHDNTGDSWDDLMAFAIAVTLSYPDWITGPNGEQKMCAEGTLVWMKDEDTIGFQQAVLTRWSDNNKHVITSYPIDWTAGGCNA